MVWVTETGSKMDFIKHIKTSVALLDRILVCTITKRCHLWAPLLSSCFTFPNLKKLYLELKATCCHRGAAALGWDMPSAVTARHLRRGSSTFESWRKWQWVMSSFAAILLLLSWAETLHLLLGKEQGVPWRKAGIWRFAVLHSLRGSFKTSDVCYNKNFAWHTHCVGLSCQLVWPGVSIIPQFRCDKPWRVRQRKCNPVIAEHKVHLQ